MKSSRTVWAAALAVWLAGTGFASAATIVHYNFQNNVLDQSGNGNDGTIFGGLTFGPGVTGTAINFDNPVGGSDGTQYVTLPNSAGILGLNNSSFSYALRYKSTDSAQTNGRLFGGRVGPNSGMSFVYNASGTAEAIAGVLSSLSFMNAGPGGSSVTTDGNWHWAVVTLDRGTNTLALYIDNNPAATNSVGILGPISFQDLAIGRFNGDQGGDIQYAARGTSVQDFYLFDTALTPSEVQSLIAPVNNAVVPEPSTFALLALGGLGLCAYRRRNRR